jgi:predicted porin
MKKTVMLGTLLSAMAAAQAAQSAAQVYGVVGAFVGSIKRSGDAAATIQEVPGGLTTSFVGARGEEELGGGYKTVFALESFLRPDTGEQGRYAGDPLFARNAWVGIDGDFGRLMLGRQVNPTYLVMTQLSPFGNATGFAPLVLHTFVPQYGGAILGDTVWNNALRYVSPNIQGFRGMAVYAPGEVANQAGVANLGLHGLYTGGKLTASLSMQRLRVNGVTPLAVEQKAGVAGLAYDFGLAKAYASLARTRIDGGKTTKMADTGLSVPLSDAGAVLAEVARSVIDAPGVADAQRTTASLGYDHRLSARTDVYAIYVFDKKNTAGAAGSSALGIRHAF